MPLRHAVIYVPALVIACAPVAGEAVTTGVAITVRVYDAAGLEPIRTATALAVAEAALASASVDLTWEQCLGGGSRCGAPMGRADLAVRLVRVPVAPGFRGSLPLGDALVDPHAGTGVLATIYIDRVEWLAAVSGGDAPTLLGRAIAHEIGHLLLASSAHSSRGLMRAVWSRDEIRHDRRTDWAFTASDIEAIRLRVRARA
jgi:hypothetical protein